MQETSNTLIFNVLGNGVIPCPTGEKKNQRTPKMGTFSCCKRARATFAFGFDFDGQSKLVVVRKIAKYGTLSKCFLPIPVHIYLRVGPMPGQRVFPRISNHSAKVESCSTNRFITFLLAKVMASFVISKLACLVTHGWFRLTGQRVW